HSLKHKTTPVNVLLLGRVSPQNDAVDVVEISDSVPLFHFHLALLPQLEISLIMIEEYAAKGLGIVGFFHAIERFDDVELSNVAKKIILLDNKKLEALPKGKDRSPGMQFTYTRDASKNLKLVVSDGNSRLVIKEPSVTIVLLDYISSEKWQDVVDFDDHLDDVNK
ncbi:LOW QUALITY PROTEIN: UPF0172 domain-containing protein, partial [Cephalotus follicularis]